MKNSIQDLTNILFAQLEDLSDIDNEGKIDLLIQRAKASVSISNQIIKAKALELNIQKEENKNKSKI